MVYTKIKLKGIEMNVEVDPDKLYTTCCECGKEIHLDESWFNHIVNEYDFLSIFELGYVCDQCTKKKLLKEKNIEWRKNYEIS